MAFMSTKSKQTNKQIMPKNCEKDSFLKFKLKAGQIFECFY